MSEYQKVTLGLAIKTVIGKLKPFYCAELLCRVSVEQA